ncbi:hypothetical protein Aple_065610 [Acrocarpospora pleiomorpha]|uniref:Uncharacterized protein n=1 Tax=Acrocarpospora pleiomorpha TaxID=90975 RepID=A0A5M3XRI7_9ACTN|nr:hypothetical protein Aple_065610 [Acrocarpospora pleiomorpha]
MAVLVAGLLSAGGTANATSIYAGNGMAASPAIDSAQPSIVPKTVVLDATNSEDITRSKSGNRLLNEFSQRMQAKGITALKSTEAMTSQYDVISVDLAKILPDSRCKRGTESLILPKSTTEVRYIGGPRNEQDGTNPCMVTVEWDDQDPDPQAQDDPQSRSEKAVGILEAPYVEQYHEYCAARKTYTGFWEEPCYKRFVLKYDGNSTWNYYSFEAWNTCQANVLLGELISCGRGQEAAADSPTLYSVDFSPQNPSTGNCRAVSYEVQLYNAFTVGGSYNHCDEQRVYDYPEPGKMSTYYKGQTEYLRTTRHQVSVKVAQNDGRPQWTNWFNGETCSYIDGGFCI